MLLTFTCRQICSYHFCLSQNRCLTFIAEGVQGVDHELEDAVPHQ